MSKGHYFLKDQQIEYRKVVSSNTSRLEAHVCIYRLLMKGIFDAYVMWPFDKKFIFELLIHIKKYLQLRYSK